MAQTNPDDVFAAWVADVRARGNVPTVAPSGPRRGRKAERTPDGRYLAPPPEVQRVEDVVLDEERRAIRYGEWVSDLEESLDIAWGWLTRLPDAVLGAVRWTGSIPRHATQALLGLPGWVIPLGAVALAVYLATQWGRRPGSA